MDNQKSARCGCCSQASARPLIWRSSRGFLTGVYLGFYEERVCRETSRTMRPLCLWEAEALLKGQAESLFAIT